MSKTCNNCGTNEEMAVMPIAQHEKDQERSKTIIKWLVIVNVIVFLAAAASNAFWIIREMQTETETVIEETIIDAKLDGEGVNIVGGGDVNYGAEN